MNNRIKEIRKSLNIGSQQDFAERLGISVSNVSSYESGRRNPSDAAIKLICEKCFVREEWLRYGKGEMLIPERKNDEISKLLGDVVKKNDDNFKYRLINALAKLDDDGWDKLEELVDMISKK